LRVNTYLNVANFLDNVYTAEVHRTVGGCSSKFKKHRFCRHNDIKYFM
jgi:hypothetical protein